MMRDNYRPCADEPGDLAELLADHQYDYEGDLDDEATARRARTYARDILSILRRELRYEDALRWKERRIALSAQEDSGDFPHPDDWAASDDEAAALLSFILDQLTEDEPRPYFCCALSAETSGRDHNLNCPG